MTDKSVEGQPPPGFKLRHTLRGHEGDIGRIAWSPDGRMFASPSTAAKPTWVGWNPVPLVRIGLMLVRTLRPPPWPSP